MALLTELALRSHWTDNREQLSTRLMKLTPVVLLLPVFIFYLDRSLREIPHALGVVLSVTWFLSALLNLGWGVYVSRQSTFQGFLCVAMGVVQILSVLVFPVIAAARMGT